MDVAVVGAGGDIGRQIATQLVEEGLIAAHDRLQLVEAPNSDGLNVALGLRSDLADAFGETLPQVDVGAGPDDLVADVVIFAAGATVPCDPAAVRTREDLGEANAPVFESYAAALEKDGTGGEIVIVVSNPVELGVAIFARHVERHRVIGMGSFLDTIRFRNEIARSLAVRRQRVRGLVIGEHGPHMLPLWSTVSVQGMGEELAAQKLGALMAEGEADLAAELRNAARQVAAGDIEAAYAQVDRLPVAARVALRPYVTHFTGAKTALGTAQIVVRLTRTILSGNDTLAACQMRIEGEFLGLTGTIGVPVLMSNAGIVRVEPLELTDDETARFRSSFAAVQEFLARF